MQQLIANKLLNQEVVSALILTHLLQNKQPVEHFFFFLPFSYKNSSTYLWAWTTGVLIKNMHNMQMRVFKVLRKELENHRNIAVKLTGLGVFICSPPTFKWTCQHPRYHGNQASLMRLVKPGQSKCWSYTSPGLVQDEPAHYLSQPLLLEGAIKTTRVIYFTIHPPLPASYISCGTPANCNTRQSQAFSYVSAKW